VVSFRGRLTLVNAVVLGCVLLAAILLLPSQLSRILKANLDASLLTLAETEVASATDAPGNAVHLHPIAPYGEGADMARLDKIVVLLDRDGRVVGQTSALPDLRFRLPDGFAEEIREGRTTFRTVSSLSGHPIRLVGIPIQGGEPAGMVLVVGTSLQGVENVLQLLDLVLLGVSVIVLAVAGAAGYFLARRALQPVGSLVSQVDQISLQNIGRRLEEPRSEDELAELTRVLNRMLGRLEKGLEIQRRFTSDASHEIRTPLSNLRGEIEVALMRPRSPEQYQETLQSSLEEVNRLTSLVEGGSRARRGGEPRRGGPAARPGSPGGAGRAAQRLGGSDPLGPAGRQPHRQRHPVLPPERPDRREPGAQRHRGRDPRGGHRPGDHA
jgi:two-component system OmpR family sensor kinase